MLIQHYLFDRQQLKVEALNSITKQDVIDHFQAMFWNE